MNYYYLIVNVCLIRHSDLTDSYSYSLETFPRIIDFTCNHDCFVFVFSL